MRPEGAFSEDAMHFGRCFFLCQKMEKGTAQRQDINIREMVDDMCGEAELGAYDNDA